MFGRLAQIATICTLISAPATAAVVHVSGSGYLDTATGTAKVGDAFSFSTSYDDSAPGQNVPGSSYYYFPSPTPVFFTVDGQQYVDPILYYLEYNASTSKLYIISPADYGGPRVSLTFDLNRPAGSDTNLPTAAELNGKAGLFSYQIPGLAQYASGGSGLFTAVTSPIPEPATWAMMVVGIGVIGGMVRRRAAASVRTTSAVRQPRLA